MSYVTRSWNGQDRSLRSVFKCTTDIFHISPPPQGRTVCARRLAENDVMEYIAKPNMRDDASSPANRVRFVTNFIICNKAKVRRDEGIPPYCAQTNALLFICPSKALGTPSPTLGKAHRPFLLFAPGGFRQGRVTPALPAILWFSAHHQMLCGERY